MTTCGDYGGDRDASAGAGGGEVRPKTSNLTGMAKGGTRREGGVSAQSVLHVRERGHARAGVGWGWVVASARRPTDATLPR